jgi:thymidine kinase
MTKLYFRYGTMNSSKTANLLMVAHNYISQNRKVLLIKPQCDTRWEENGGTNLISSRVGTSMKADIVLAPDVTNISAFLVDVSCVLVDEAQFLSTDNINMLRNIAMTIPVMCWGLRTDYTTKLFEGSKRLMEVADSIQEVKTICVGCERKSIVNAKFTIDPEAAGKIIIKNNDSKNQVDLGSEDKYQPMCWQCWRES